MKNGTVRFTILSLAVVALFLTGCASPFGDVSPLMKKSTRIEAPPAGKSLVLIHRPRNRQGYVLHTGVWDRNTLIGDLGNGHSTAYVCDPGEHYFLNRSVERVGVVNAQLLPDQTYCLWLNIAGAFIASFQLEPVKPGDKAWEKVEISEKENIWVERSPAAAQHEAARQKEIELIMRDFVDGPKRDRVRTLGPKDHR